MVLYLAQQYLYRTLAIFGLFSALLLLLEWDFFVILTTTLFWSSLFGMFFTIHYFRKRSLWPIYNNLKYPKYIMLLFFFLWVREFTYYPG